MQGDALYVMTQNLVKNQKWYPLQRFKQIAPWLSGWVLLEGLLAAIFQCTSECPQQDQGPTHHLGPQPENRNTRNQ